MVSTEQDYAVFFMHGNRLWLKNQFLISPSDLHLSCFKPVLVETVFIHWASPGTRMQKDNAEGNSLFVARKSGAELLTRSFRLTHFQTMKLGRRLLTTKGKQNKNTNERGKTNRIPRFFAADYENTQVQEYKSGAVTVLTAVIRGIGWHNHWRVTFQELLVGNVGCKYL